MSKPQKLNTEQELEDAVLAFHHRVQNELHKEALRLKFTPSQLEVLRYVFEKGDPTMKNIADRLRITPPSVTTIIDILTKKTLVRREQSAKDRRTIKIILTPKSLKLFATFKNKKLAILQNIFAELKPKDKKELTRILSILTKNSYA